MAYKERPMGAAAKVNARKVLILKWSNGHAAG
jgi:hypothetical protein